MSSRTRLAEKNEYLCPAPSNHLARRNARQRPSRRMARQHGRTVSAAFCTRNPKPCPLIEITPPGDPEPARSAPGADIRADLPGYRVYRHGDLVEKREEIGDLGR